MKDTQSFVKPITRQAFYARPFILITFLAIQTFTQQAQSQELLDSAVIAKIEDQAFNHSQVMDIAFHLTDASGPRLSNSPGLSRAEHWALTVLHGWMLQKVNLEPWGTFGNGWEVQKCYLALKEPYYQTITACPEAWTGGSGGPFEAEVMLYYPKDSLEQAVFRGHLRGKIVLYPSGSARLPSFDPNATRYADSDLVKITQPVAQVYYKRHASPPSTHPKLTNSRPVHPHVPRMTGSSDFFQQERVLGRLTAGGNTPGLFHIGQGGSNMAGAPSSPMDLALLPEDYDRLERLLEAGIRVVVEGDVQTRLIEDDSIGYNVVGEIPGTDSILKDQVVMMGGHLDSWHAATGATDNGAGAAVMLEVVRILQAISIHPRRTIRIALWSGEEQGLLGSLGYVKTHFGDPQTRQWTDDQAKISAYYNLDNGTGKIRGIYLQGDSAAGPIFQSWLKSFRNLGASTVTINNTDGTDHESFVEDGIPGFQFIQDPIEYYNHTHHTNLDSYDHLLPDDLKQAAAIIAAFVYQTAMRDEMIPRKSLPPIATK